MPWKKEPEQYAPKGKRLVMHPCHMQSLTTSRFIEVANQTLRGQFSLLTYRTTHKPLRQPAPSTE
jgi:hypothetical protein